MRFDEDPFAVFNEGIRIPMTIEQFRKIPRNPAYDQVFLDGEMIVTERRGYNHCVLSLGEPTPWLVNAQDIVTIRPLTEGDWDSAAGSHGFGVRHPVPVRVTPDACREGRRGRVAGRGDETPPVRPPDRRGVLRRGRPQGHGGRRRGPVDPLHVHAIERNPGVPRGGIHPVGTRRQHPTHGASDLGVRRERVRGAGGRHGLPRARGGGGSAVSGTRMSRPHSRGTNVSSYRFHWSNGFRLLPRGDSRRLDRRERSEQEGGLRSGGENTATDLAQEPS